MRNKLIQLLLLIIFIGCIEKEEVPKLEEVLTGGSIQMWEMDIPLGRYDSNIYYTFDITGRCEEFRLTKDNLMKIVNVYDDIPSERGRTNRWALKGNILKIRGSRELKVVRYTKDSIILVSHNEYAYPYKENVLIFKPVKKWKLDKKEMEWRDSIIYHTRDKRLIEYEESKRNRVEAEDN